MWVIMGHIFISYSRRDQEFVDSFVGKLEATGKSIWIDRQEIKVGRLWRTQIVQAIDTCDGFLLMLSNHSAASDNVRREIDLALDARRSVFILLLEPVKLPAPIRYQLIGLQRIDVQKLGAQKAVKQLIAVLAEEAEETEEQPVRQVELIIPGIGKGTFDRKRKEKLADFLSKLTGTAPSQIQIAPVIVGSQGVLVDMPAVAAFALKALALNRDRRLKKFGIKSLRVAGDKKYINTSLGVLTSTATMGFLKLLWHGMPALLPSLVGITIGKIIVAISIIGGTTILVINASDALLPPPNPTLTETSTLLPSPASTSLPTETLAAPPTDLPTETPTQRPTDIPTQTSTNIPTPTATDIPTAIPTQTPLPPTDTPRPVPTLPKELVAKDKAEGIMPDFLTLAVRYDDQTVHIAIAMNGIEKIGGAEFIYMYSTHHDLIRLLPGSFRIERDNDGDGFFEEVIDTGTTDNSVASSINMDIPIQDLPDIATKAIWVFSGTSQDRLPDQGQLNFPTPSP